MTIEATDLYSVQDFSTTKSEPIYISKDVIEEARELANYAPNVLIYGDKVIGLEDETIAQLHQSFTGNIKRYENLFIATDYAKKYMDKITEFVMHQVNVVNSDENIQFDKDKNVKVDVKELQNSSETKENQGKSRTDRLLEILYKRLAQIEKQIKILQSQSLSTLNMSQLRALNLEKSSIMSEILDLLKPKGK